jgi:hypothetical protein
VLASKRRRVANLLDVRSYGAAWDVSFTAMAVSFVWSESPERTGAARV